MTNLLRGMLMMVAAAAPAAAADKAVLVVHGGAGVMNEAAMKANGLTRADFENGLADALHAGWKAMQAPGSTATDGAEAAIRSLEDNPLFNAGKGAVLTSDGRAELDACIMEGNAEGRGNGKLDPRKRAGAVTGVIHVKNPISAARAVMEMEGSRHALLAGEGAEAFVLNEENRKKYAIERVENHFFWTDRRLRQVYRAKKMEPKMSTMNFEADAHFGTVGAVALKDGHITAGTSTGGTANKWPGRVGDTPIVGAGNYADDRTCGVSGTGTGELFMRFVVGHDVAARMRYKNIPLAQAAQETIDEMPDDEGGSGGLIALDKDGNVACPVTAKSDGMSRGYVTANGDIFVAIYAKDEWKKVEPRK